MASGNRDYYEILGLNISANDTQLFQAYITLSEMYYPGKNPDKDTKNKFEEVSEAFQVLTNPKWRADYDQYRIHPKEAFDTRGMDFKDSLVLFMMTHETLRETEKRAKTNIRIGAAKINGRLEEILKKHGVAQPGESHADRSKRSRSHKIFITP